MLILVMSVMIVMQAINLCNDCDSTMYVSNPTGNVGNPSIQGSVMPVMFVISHCNQHHTINNLVIQFVN